VPDPPVERRKEPQKKKKKKKLNGGEKRTPQYATSAEKNKKSADTLPAPARQRPKGTVEITDQLEFAAKKKGDKEARNTKKMKKVKKGSVFPLPEGKEKGG